MLLLAFLILLLLAFMNYRLSGKAIFHPGVVYCASWAGGVLLLWIAGDLFYPVSPPTLLIFVGGALVFSIGSTLALLYPEALQKRYTKHLSQRFINTLIFVLLAGIPFAIWWTFNQVSEHPSANFFISAYRTMLDEKLQETIAYSLLANFVTFANIFALVMVCEKEGYKKRWLLVVLSAFFLGILIASRASVVGLILSLVCLDWLKKHRIRWKPLIVLGTAFMVCVIAIAVFLGKGEADPNASVADNAVPVVHGLELYAVGSLVAFDQVVKDTNIVAHNWRITNALEHIWHRIDKKYQPADTHLEFMNVGPNSAVINTYTGYFVYVDLGYGGMMSMILALGFILTTCYKKAIAGKKVWMILYAVLFSGLPLSLFGDYFFLSFYYLLKVYLSAWFIYEFPSIISKFRFFQSQLVRTWLYSPK